MMLLVDRPGAAQTYFWIGNVGVAIDYPQRAELQIANTLFGGRFTSMLMTALRVESGLTYSAHSDVEQYSSAGAVSIRSYTETETTVETIDKAISQLSTAEMMTAQRYRLSAMSTTMNSGPRMIKGSSDSHAAKPR